MTTFFVLSFLVSATPDPTCVSGKRCAVRYLFEGEVDGSTVGSAIEFIEKANDNGAEEIIFEINSPGGSVRDGFRLARAIEESDTPVTCVVDGQAASMSFYILQSCDQRKMTRRATLMAHEPALSYPVEGGHWEDWQAIANMMDAERKALAEHCQHRLKISIEEYNKRTAGSMMWFFNWKDALKYGAVDGITKNAKTEFKRAQRRS